MNVYAILARLTTGNNDYPEFEQTFWVVANSAKQAKNCLRKYFRVNDVPCITGYATYWHRAGNKVVWIKDPELIREHAIICSDVLTTTKGRNNCKD
ncbi:MAG: hypothetical protein QW136_00215 [Nitrososphaerales archaeon]